MITTNNNDDDNDDNDMTTTKVVMVLKRLLDGGQSMEVIRQITLALTLFSLMILSHWCSSHYDVYASWQVSGAYLTGCLPALLMWCWLGLGYGMVVCLSCSSIAIIIIIMIMILLLLLLPRILSSLLC